MRRLLLSAAILGALCASAAAQTAPCAGVGGVNNVPSTGYNCSAEPTPPTYFATSVGLAPGSAPTDIYCLTGSATRTVRLKEVRISGVAATAINITALLTKHASANTGGTAATSTALPVPYAMDSTYSVPTATATAYTVNPTINDAAPGIISATTVFLPVTSTAGPGSLSFLYWDAGGVAVASPTLRGTAQQICVNLNGVTAPSSGLMTVSMYWTELPF